jgi:hypothetical protein
MRFLLLIRDGGTTRGWTDEREIQAFHRMMRWAGDLRARGVLTMGEPLCPDSEGVRVQHRGGTPVVTDGPFPETKDVVGGFTLIECATKADALEIAKACPAIEWGSVEVREIRVGPALRRT